MRRAGRCPRNPLSRRTEASNEGAEADAVGAQARLALSGAAGPRCVAGRLRPQAIAYLDQALAISTDPSDRGPLFDRAAEAAGFAARASEEYAQGAVEAYRQVGDPVAALAATGQLGKTLIDGGEIGRALEVLDAALAEAESVDDETSRAAILANLARVHFRLGHSAESIAAADQALAIAERLDLEEVVSEALVNKAAALTNIGRRREAVALDEAALQMAVKLPSRNFEMRVRDNLAAALSNDEPVRATQLSLDAAELARQVGDRGMYIWLTAFASWGVRAEGRGWQEHAERIREALDTATVRSDRIRLTVFRAAAFDATRGEADLADMRSELEALLGDSIDPEDQFLVTLGVACVALMSNDPNTAYRLATDAQKLDFQSLEGATYIALRAAIWAGDHEWIRTAAARQEDAQSSGPLSTAFRLAAAGAIAFVDGRRADTVEAFRGGVDILDRLDQPFDAAEMALDAVILMPADPEIRRLAEAHRVVLESVGAHPSLERLDAALGSMSLASSAAAAITVEAGPYPAPRSSARAEPRARGRWS